MSFNLVSKSDKKIAILDANNFYVSCERLFQPKWEKTPAAVLSNNDGCFIARSQEVKDMGIKMGQPVFQLEEDKKDRIKMFSSNYVLYGDISDRISNILKRFTPKLEIYSIDESFLDLTHISDNQIDDYMRLIKSEIFRLVGIPVSIGLGPNKTIAKLMNHLSKTKPELGGICNYWTNNVDIEQIEIDEVWGIGSKWKKKLNCLDIKTVGDFKKVNPSIIRKLLTVVGYRTLLELNEILVHEVTTKFKKPKIVTSSRSFGKLIWQKQQIHNSLWTFIEDVCSKLQKENLKPREILIFAATNRFQPDYFVWVKKIRIYYPSNDPQIIWNQIFKIADELPMKLYARAGVISVDLIPNELVEGKLFNERFEHVEKPNVDSQIWLTRRDFLSPNWTTDWDEVPKIY